MSQNVLSLPHTTRVRASVKPISPCKPARELLTAWLLFLLDRQATHGYDLHRQLEAHGISTDLAAMYRTLRRLENDGYAASSWGEPVSGPRRRQYELTAKGQRELDVLVRAIAATRDVHSAFLHAHGGVLR